MRKTPFKNIVFVLMLIGSITVIFVITSSIYHSNHTKISISTSQLYSFQWDDSFIVRERLGQGQLDERIAVEIVNVNTTVSGALGLATAESLSQKKKGNISSGSWTPKPKLILVYTPLFGSIPWPWLPYTYNFMESENKPCAVPNCKLTYDKKLLPESDVVLFHGRDVPGADEMHRLRAVNLKQIWGFLMHESPENTYFNAKDYNGLFNWTITYRGDSDSYIPYQGWRKRSQQEPQHRNYAEEKTKLMSFVNSHCDETRMQFIRKLKKLIPIDVYGGCSRMFQDKVPNCPRHTKECDDMQKQYKFYLAFENGFCRDYITEKYWINGLAMGLVPVVAGGANYSDTRIAIKGSFINVLDFKSLQELADHLLYLDRNNTAYNEYHAWRSEYELKGGHVMCHLCELINQKQITSKTIDMVKFWGVSENCWKARTGLKRFFDKKR